MKRGKKGLKWAIIKENWGVVNLENFLIAAQSMILWYWAMNADEGIITKQEVRTYKAMELLPLLSHWAVDARTAFDMPQNRATAHAQKTFHSPKDEDVIAQRAIFAKVYWRTVYEQSLWVRFPAEHADSQSPRSTQWFTIYATEITLARENSMRAGRGFFVFFLRGIVFDIAILYDFYAETGYRLFLSSIGK